MCFFRFPSAPKIVSAPPVPAAPLNPQTTSTLPTKKDLVDPDDEAGLETAAKGKLASNQSRQGIGANALKINVKPTDVAQAANRGGVNTV